MKFKREKRRKKEKIMDRIQSGLVDITLIDEFNLRNTRYIKSLTSNKKLKIHQYKV